MKTKAPAAAEAGEHVHGVAMSGSYSGRIRRDVSEILAAELEAKIAFAKGERDRALALAREAASAEDAMTFEFGPPAVIKPAHELLGELLLELDPTDRGPGGVRVVSGKGPRPPAVASRPRTRHREGG